MDQDDGQQYDHTEQQRYEAERGLAPALLLGGRLELMARVVNKHRHLARLNSEIDALIAERDAARLEYNMLCAQAAEVRS